MLIVNGTTPTILIKAVEDEAGTTAPYSEPVTGATVAVQISKNGGTFATATNSPATEIGSSLGAYKITLTASETDTDGPIWINATATGMADWTEIHQVFTSWPTTLVSAEHDSIADHVLRRNFATTEASSDGDTIQRYCLLNAGRGGATNRVALATAVITTYKEDGTTAAYTRDVNSTDATAEPITGVGG